MPEKEYIEREAVIAAITVDGFEHFSGCLSSSEVRLIELMRDSVSEVPTADVAEVKHGEWVEYQTPNIICCSECDWATGVDEKSFKFCPSCGAKMDGGDKSGK